MGENKQGCTCGPNAQCSDCPPRLPETVEEFQKARREAYVAGAMYYASGYTGSVEAQSRKRYPIRKKVPRVVEDEHGVAWRIADGILQARHNVGLSQQAVAYEPTLERLRLWGDLAANPDTYEEEVDE